MKLNLPHREVKLNLELSFEERNNFIHTLLEEQIEFHENTMTLEEYFRYTWNKQNSIIAMDIIGYYLTKNNTEGEDREVLSNGKAKEMKKGSQRLTTFSGMGFANQVSLGLIDPEEYEY